MRTPSSVATTWFERLPTGIVPPTPTPTPLLRPKLPPPTPMLRPERRAHASPRTLLDPDHGDLLGAAVARLDRPAEPGQLALDRGRELAEFEAVRVGRIGGLDRDRAARDRLAEVEAGDRGAGRGAAAHVHRAAGDQSGGEERAEP